MSTGCTISIYLESKTTLLDKINAIDLLIDKMITKISETIDGNELAIDEYWMNDGQMNVKTSYKSLEDIEMSVFRLERMKQMYVNRYNGRSFVLRDFRGLR
ncbi:MAG: hypothetical protein DRQ39_09735 [Gammaproteobacteria bacterium]|nr:MAG: hypothetical protein DRQ39_09735 [Gammaproteobacteria bacterium]